MSIEQLEITLATAFLFICAAGLYLCFSPPAPWQLPDSRQLPRTHDPAQWRRRAFAATILGIVVIATLVPFLLAARDRAIGSMFNNPREWISDELPAERRYARFIRQFQELDAIVVSWRGCHVDDERLKNLSAELKDSASLARRSQCERYYARVVTGYDMVRDSMSAPLSLTRAQAIARWRGSLVGMDGTTSCAVVYLKEEGVEQRVAAIELLREIVTQTCQLPAAEIILAGAPVDGMTIDLNSIASADRFGIPSNVIVLVFCLCCLRSLRLTIVVFGIAAFGQLLSVALIDWFGLNMNAILIVMPPLVLVLTVSAGVHLVNYYHDEVRGQGQVGAARRAISKGALPCLIATTTTIVGLLSLLASDSRAISLFAIFSSICLVSTTALMFLVLPGAMEAPPWWTVGRQLAHRRVTVSRWLTNSLATTVCAARYVIILACLVAMGVSVYGLSKLKTSVNVRSMFPAESEVLSNYRWLEDNLGSIVPVEIVLRFEHRDRWEPLEQLRVVGEVHEAVENMSAVSGVVSATTFFPELPEGSDVSKDRMGLKLYQLMALGKRIRELPFYRESRDLNHWRVSGCVPALTDIDYGAFLDELATSVDPVLYAAKQRHQKHGVSASYTGPMSITYASQRALLSDLLDSFITALLLITVMMMLYLRSILAGLIVMLPNLFPTVLLFGTISLFGIPIDIGSVMTASVALGIAVDDTLHYVTWFRREYALGRDTRAAVRKAYDHCGWAMIQSTLICGTGMLVYTLSPFVPAQRFAFMMVALLLAALVGDLLLLPALLAGPLGRLMRPPLDVGAEEQLAGTVLKPDAAPEAIAGPSRPLP